MNDYEMIDGLKKMDFWHKSGDVIETWLDDNDDFLLSLHDEDFDGRDKLLDILKADPRTVYMETFVIISENVTSKNNPNKEYEVTLNVLFSDKDENSIEEKDYMLSDEDNAYMVDCLRKGGYIEAMEQEIRDNRREDIDNER